MLEARFGFSTMQAGKKPIQAGGPSMQTLFGIPGLPTDPQYTGGVTYQYFIDGGWTSLGRLWTSPQYQNPTIWDPKANYTRLMGSHSLKAGVEYQMLHVAQQDLHPVMGGNVYTSPAYGAGYGFYNKLYGPLTGPVTSENTRMFDYADFLLGYQAEMGLVQPHRQPTSQLGLGRLRAGRLEGQSPAYREYGPALRVQHAHLRSQQ